MAIPEQPDINTLFMNLDRWRHFAGYPLEARVDAFFGLYLPQVIEKQLSVADMHKQVVPQFPLKKPENYQSERVDFFAISRNKTRAFLVEIKTDMASQRDTQRVSLDKAAVRGLPEILRELKLIVRASRGNSRAKYFCLLLELEQMGLLALPKELRVKICKGNHQGTTKLIENIKVCLPANAKVEVVYVLPKADYPKGQNGPQLITFDDFAGQVRARGELGQTFAEYLAKWKTGPGQAIAFQETGDSERQASIPDSGY